MKSEFENRDVLSPVKLKVQRCLLPRFDYDFSGSPDLAPVSYTHLMALITNARLLILLEAGKLILALSWRGALIVYFIFFLDVYKRQSLSQTSTVV